MAESFLRMLLALSLGGSALAALLMLLRRIAGRRVPSLFWYCAWLLVLARFVLPVPGLVRWERSAASLPAPGALPADAQKAEPRPYSAESDLAPGGAAAGLPELPVAENAFFADGTEGEAQADTETSAARPLTRWELCFLLWAAGAGGSALWYLIGYLRFRSALLPTLRPASMEERAEQQALYPRPWPALCRSAAVYTPMLLGLLRPVIVLPEREYAPEMLRGILRHELTHFRRGDLAFKWFAAAVCSVHWFNPLTLLLRREIDRSCELSCDEWLLRDMDREEKQHYGELLLTLASDHPLPRRVVAVSFATEKRDLKERLVQIMTFKKKGRAALVLMLCAALLLAGCAAAVGPGAAMSGTRVETDPAETAAPVSPDEVMPTAGIYGPITTPSPDVSQRAEADAYYVHTADEFLAALGSDRLLVLDAAEYDLSQTENYGTSGPHYSWKDTNVDGYELTLSNLQNLTILGAGAELTSVVAEPRYANVITFDHCENITIAHLTAGHTIEPGFCTGGVLDFSDSDGISIDCCDLYGCGTVGIIASNCRRVVAESTTIRECSYGAVQADSCYDVRFMNGEIHDCGWKEDFGCFNLLEANSTTGFVVYNTPIYSNAAEILLKSAFSNGVELRGCDVHGNQFDLGMFSVQGVSPTVDGCALSDNAFVRGSWYHNYDGQTPGTVVNGEGKELAEPDFLAMRLAKYASDYEGPVVAAPEKPAGAVNVEGRTEYHVSTADEFLACIGSDTVIYLDMETLDLSEAASYGGYGGTHYYWRNDFDGPTLVIAGVENLRITGKGYQDTLVEAHPRYAMVLSFYDCVNVSVESLTAGHTRGQGACSGDVLEFRNCADCTVLSCGLFGCGVNGINVFRCQDLTIQETVIYECSGFGAVVRDSYNTAFAGCAIRDCGSDMVVDNNGGVSWDGKTDVPERILVRE